LEEDWMLAAVAADDGYPCFLPLITPCGTTGRHSYGWILPISDGLLITDASVAACRRVRQSVSACVRLCVWSGYRILTFSRSVSGILPGSVEDV
jgi:hypothetical protein